MKLIILVFLISNFVFAQIKDPGPAKLKVVLSEMNNEIFIDLKGLANENNIVVSSLVLSLNIQCESECQVGFYPIVNPVIGLVQSISSLSSSSYQLTLSGSSMSYVSLDSDSLVRLGKITSNKKIKSVLIPSSESLEKMKRISSSINGVDHWVQIEGIRIEEKEIIEEEKLIQPKIKLSFFDRLRLFFKR